VILLLSTEKGASAEAHTGEANVALERLGGLLLSNSAGRIVVRIALNGPQATLLYTHIVLRTPI